MCTEYVTFLQCGAIGNGCNVIIDRWRDHITRCHHPSTCGPRRRVENYMHSTRGTICQKCEDAHEEREIVRLRRVAEVYFTLWRNRTLRNRGSGSEDRD